jgi:hypothetical protein
LTRWRVLRSLIRAIPFCVAELIAAFAAAYLASAPTYRWSSSFGRPTMVTLMALLGIGVLAIFIGDAIQRPIAWKNHSHSELAQITKIKRLTRKLCRQRDKLTVSLPVSSHCRLLCTYPTKSQIRRGFWRFVCFGRDTATHLQFRYVFIGADPEVTPPEDQLYVVMFFGGSRHWIGPGSSGKLDPLDFNRIIDRLEAAVGQYSHQ